MRGNIVVAAAVAGGAFIIASIIFVLGIGRALNQSADRLAEAVDQHADQVTRAGDRVGEPVARAIGQMNDAHVRHAKAVVEAGKVMAQPSVTWKSPLPIVDDQPLRIQGTVGVELGENEDAKKKLFEK